jgi:hypothetical protein
VFKQSNNFRSGLSPLRLGLLSCRVLDNLRAAQGTLSLGRRYGTRRLESACQRALFFGDIRYQTLKSILAKGLDQQPLAEADQPLSASYTSRRFVRPGAELWVHLEVRS